MTLAQSPTSQTLSPHHLLNGLEQRMNRNYYPPNRWGDQCPDTGSKLLSSHRGLRQQIGNPSSSFGFSAPRSPRRLCSMKPGALGRMPRQFLGKDSAPYLRPLLAYGSSTLGNQDLDSSLAWHTQRDPKGPCSFCLGPCRLGLDKLRECPGEL